MKVIVVLGSSARVKQYHVKRISAKVVVETACIRMSRQDRGRVVKWLWYVMINNVQVKILFITNKTQFYFRLINITHFTLYT